MNLNPAQRYLNRFLRLPFARLVREYQKLELEIVEDLITIAGEELVANGFTKHGDVYSSRGIHLRPVISFLPNSRSLFLTIRDINDERQNSPQVIQIAHFGLVREIVLETPRSVPLPSDAMSERLRMNLMFAYAALEQAFLSNARELERAVFRRLYDAIEVQLTVKNKKRCFERVWVFIGELKVGFYYFDAHVLRRVIEHYKSNQKRYLSPAELAMWILTAPLPFEKSLGIQAWREGKDLSLPWADVAYIADAPLIYEAEIALFESKSFTSYTPCEHRGFFLTIACPTEVSDDVMPEMEEIKESLCMHFRAGLREWSPYVKVIKKISEVAEASTAATFLGRVLGAAASEFIKP